MQKTQDIDPTKSHIVKAPAGSGKTEMLVQRYLQLLAHACDDPCQIIAITFTRKAAAEMRRRIRQELSASSKPTEKHKIITFNLAQQVLARAKEKGWHDSTLVTEENVTTIDSFCHTLVSLDPLKAGFLSMPEILIGNDIAALYNEAVRRAISSMKSEKQHSPDIEYLLYIHNNSPSKLISAISGILANRSQVLSLIYDKSYDPRKQLSLLIKTLTSRLTDSTMSGFLSRLTSIIAANQKNFEILKYDDRPQAKDWDSAKLNEWQALADIILTKSGSVRKNIKGLPKGITPYQHLLQLAEDTVRHKDKIAPQVLYEEWLEELADCRSWCDEYTPIEITSVDAAQKLIGFAAAHLRQIFKEENKCDHTEILLAAIEVMGQEQAPTLLAERLGQKLRHILVDEFQDTSLGQLFLLEKITSSWDITDNNTLFLVGDPMQSIYAFRQADVRIFNRLWHRKILGQVPLERLTLTHNYRSQAEIVEWLNKNFTLIFITKVYSITNYTGYTKAIATKGGIEKPQQLGVVYEERCSSETLFQPIIDNLQRIIKEQPEASIGILARSRNDTSGLIPLLHQYGIEFDASKFSSVQDNPLVMDLMSLSRAIYNIHDQVAWYAILRAPWCGLQLGDILALAQASPEEEGFSLWTVLQKVSVSPGNYQDRLSEDAIKRIQSFTRALRTPMLARMRLSWLDTIEMAFHSLQGDSFIQDNKDLMDAKLFLEILAECSDGGTLDAKELESRISDARASFENQATVKIKTIHDAKGLEFDYVFIANMNRKAGKTTNDMLNILDFDASSRQSINIISVNSPRHTEKDEPVNSMIKSIKKQQEDQELRRLFYVAASRAKQGLFLHYGLKTKEGRHYTAPNSLFGLIYDKNSQQVLGEDLPPISTISERKSQSILQVRRIKQPQGATLEKEKTRSTQPFPAWQEPYERYKGIAIHLLMEILAAKSEGELKKLASAKKQQAIFINEINPRMVYLLKENGLDEGEIQSIRNSLADMLDSCLKDKKALWILIPEGETEVRFVRKTNREIRIDRSFVADGTRWIVDYKTTSKESFTEEDIESFHRQLKDYADAMRDIQKQKSERLPIKLGVYDPKNGFWREWDY